MALPERHADSAGFGVITRYIHHSEHNLVMSGAKGLRVDCGEQAARPLYRGGGLSHIMEYRFVFPPNLDFVESEWHIAALSSRTTDGK